MKENRKKPAVITCPVCGREYLPAEIYLPKSFLGNPSEIERNGSGKIEVFFGQSMDTDEEFCCEECNTKFKVSANVSFKTFLEDTYAFPKEYVSPLKTNRISLFEG